MSLRKPNFPENGSNETNHLNEVYGLFIMYLREVGGNSCIQQIINISRTCNCLFKMMLVFVIVVSISFEAKSRVS